MFRLMIFILFLLSLHLKGTAQTLIPFDTTHWNIQANAYVLETYQGQEAIYIQDGLAILKDSTFINGTLEFDIYLTPRRSFPGIRFRASDNLNMESFYFRPHLSGKPDCNQAVPVINGMTGWQLYVGSAYSFPYDYQFNRWTHVRIVVNDRKAQLYLDDAQQPQFSWHLKHPPRAGNLAIGGSMGAVHYANFQMDKSRTRMVDFVVKEKEKIKDIIPEWEISDVFKEELLSRPEELPELINGRNWDQNIQVEENNAANISKVAPPPGPEGNTVFARLRINSERDQSQLFHFGYSDRVVVFLNGKPIYKGNNGFRSRDYRYLGTIGLFDSVFLNLKKGENTLLLAVSEDFGGWGVSGKFENPSSITIQ